MFTGLVESVGRIYRIKQLDGKRRFIIDTVNWAHGSMEGDSICCSGCCLTIAEAPDGPDGLLTFNAVEETLAKTTLGRLEEGDRINLERAVRADSRMGGHVVQGHVDGVGKITLHTKGGPDGTGEWRMRVEPPADLGRYLTPQGAVCIAGVSLTVADMDPRGAWFDVALIPATIAKTTLVDAEVGDPVNLEMDVMAKTIVHYLEHHAPHLSRHLAGEAGASSAGS